MDVCSSRDSETEEPQLSRVPPYHAALVAEGSEVCCAIAAHAGGRCVGSTPSTAQGQTTPVLHARTRRCQCLTGEVLAVRPLPLVFPASCFCSHGLGGKHLFKDSPSV